MVKKGDSGKDFVGYEGSVHLLKRGSLYLAAQLGEHFFFDKRRNGEWSSYSLISLLPTQYLNLCHTVLCPIQQPQQ